MYGMFFFRTIWYCMLYKNCTAEIIANNGQVLPMVGDFLFVRPEQLPTENTLLKLKLMVSVVCPLALYS